MQLCEKSLNCEIKKIIDGGNGLPYIYFIFINGKL